MGLRRVGRSGWGWLFAGCVLTSVAVAAPELRPEQWSAERAPGTTVTWEPGAVVLGVAADTAASAVAQSLGAVPSEFEVEVSYDLLTWPSGDDQTNSLTFGLVSPPETPLEQTRFVRLGRCLAGALDQYRAMSLDRGRWAGRSCVLVTDRTGRLRLTRRLGEVSAACLTAGGWHTLQRFTALADGDARLYLSVSNSTDNPLEYGAVRVRFHDLHWTTFPPRRKKTGGGSTAAPPPGKDWVIYATTPGWLRIGGRAELAAPLLARDEIFGGGGDQPVGKKMLREGYASRDEALRDLAANLTKLRAMWAPTATPHEYLRAVFDGAEYNLRLERGNDPEAVLATGQQYDFAAEKALLAKLGLTPRMGWGRLWLVHATGHGTVDGGVRDDRWMTIPSQPWPDAKAAGVFHFTIADGYGGTFGYACDKWEGPYRDNFGLARAMKRLGVAEVEIYPPGNSCVRKLVAAEVPDQPRDHGAEVVGLQPLSDPPELRDWVIYLTAGKWLHIGTRTEYNLPVKAREVVWGGTSDAPARKEILFPQQRFAAYEQALRFVAKQVLNPRVGFHPGADPRETVDVALGGVDVVWQIARPDDAVTAGYGGYNCGAELASAIAAGLLPRKVFKPQWLVHATGHGTYSGNVKDDLWMMVGGAPKNGGVTIPDGMGGTFGYAVDRFAGPFTESPALVAALRQFNVKGVGLIGEDRGVSADEPIAAAVQAPDPPPRIISFDPDHGEPGQTFYLTVIAVGMKPWYHFSFGDGVKVTDETWLGRNPDGEGERWLCTVTLAPGASLQP